MKFKKILKATTILMLINICTISSLEPESGQSSKTISTTRDEPSSISVTTEKVHRKQRQSRCIRCYDENQNPESDSRYGNNRYIDDGGGRYNRNRYYPSYPNPSKRINYEDTNNWYNQNDRYDNRPEDKSRYYENRYPDRNFNNRFIERDRYSDRGDRDRYSDRYQPDRYPSDRIRNDDRYRTYDPYDNRQPIYHNRYDSGQELYNNHRGYDQGQEYRNRFNERERPYDRVRPGSYYNERHSEHDPNDRYNFRDYDYDYRNNRPPGYETHREKDYHPGRGYNNNNNPNHLPYSPSSTSGQPYLPNSQSAPRPLQSQNSSSLNTNHDNSPDYENNRHQSDNKNSNNGYVGDWNYANDRNKDKDMNSSPYGSRSRPLPGSYLFDRNSNNPIDSEDNNNSNNTEDKNLNTTTQKDNDKKTTRKVN